MKFRSLLIQNHDRIIKIESIIIQIQIESGMPHSGIRCKTFIMNLVRFCGCVERTDTDANCDWNTTINIYFK